MSSNPIIEIHTAILSAMKCSGARCTELASRWARCKTCRKVIARCSVTCGDVVQLVKECPKHGG